GPSRLWVRPLDGTAQALPQTDGAQYPFWAPDGHAIGFFTDSQLKTIDVDGHGLQVLASALGPRGGTWRDDGTILFAPGSSGSLTLNRVSVFGGNPAPVTTLAAGQTSHRFPVWLPGGREFLYFVTGSQSQAGIFLGSLDGRDHVRLTDAD